MKDKELKQFIKPLLKDINKWRKDYMATQPNNLQIDYDTFEGSAYELLGSAAVLLKDVEVHGKIDVDSLDLYAWLVELSEVRKAIMPTDTRNDLRKAINQCAGLIQNKLNVTHRNNSKSKS